MFCYQCQETNRNQGCTIAGVCGKKGDVAELLDLYIHIMRGISVFNLQIKKTNQPTEKVDKYIVDGLFSTITNTNFNKHYFLHKIREALDIREELKSTITTDMKNDAIDWYSKDENQIMEKAKQVGVMRTKNEDIRSLKELLLSRSIILDRLIRMLPHHDSHHSFPIADFPLRHCGSGFFGGSSSVHINRCKQYDRQSY